VELLRGIDSADRSGDIHGAEGEPKLTAVHRTRVQIAGVSSLDEAAFIAACGGDAIGLTLRLPSGVHDGLTEPKARAIIAALPPFVSAVVITYVEDARAAIDLCRSLGAGVLQLHGEFVDRQTDLIRAALPHLKIIRAIMVTGEDAIERARMVQRRADAIILDTFDPATGHRGATGMVHDWEISRRIVAAVQRPVILAGGLTPENVRHAIELVRPWAVDVHTGVEGADGIRDFDKIRRFIDAAQRTSGATD